MPENAFTSKYWLYEHLATKIQQLMCDTENYVIERNGIHCRVWSSRCTVIRLLRGSPSVGRMICGRWRVTARMKPLMNQPSPLKIRRNQIPLNPKPPNPLWKKARFFGYIWFILGSEIHSVTKIKYWVTNDVDTKKGRLEMHWFSFLSPFGICIVSVWKLWGTQKHTHTHTKLSISRSKPHLNLNLILNLITNLI